MPFPPFHPRPRLVAATAAALLAFTAVDADAAPPLPAAAPPFVDATAAAGLDFHHFNGMTGELYFAEMMGMGVALFDADGDGDLDLYATQGDLIGPGDELADALAPHRHRGPPRHRLYRNDSRPGPGGRRRLAFTDVTADAGIPPGGYGMGVAVGDVEGDGDLDLYVANLGADRLLENRGDGTFEDATAKAGVADEGWSSGAAFLDYDTDGDLDLYVVRYVAWDAAKNPRCIGPDSRRDYCGPADFPPLADRLLENRGDGTFEDVSAAAGIARAPQPGLGVVVVDANEDGRPDLYVANDGTPNQLWLNRGDGTFRDGALLAGVAVGGDGRAEAGMGVDAADHDNDGDEDLFVVHLTGETNTLYLAHGGGLYEDATAAAGLAAPSLPYTSFGTRWLDYDNDGWLDLLIVNGAVKILEPRARAGDPFPLGMHNQLFRNLGRGAGGAVRYQEVTAAAGRPFAVERVSRAAAFGDLDDDGDTDVAIGNVAGPLTLLENVVGQDRPWLGLSLVDRRGRVALGAGVEVVRAGAPTLWRRAYRDGSYGASSDPRVLVGLGDQPRVTALRVHWPSGAVESFPPPPLGRYTEVREGTGRKVAPAGRSGGGGGTGHPGAAGARREEPEKTEEEGTRTGVGSELVNPSRAVASRLPGVARKARGRRGSGANVEASRRSERPSGAGAVGRGWLLELSVDGEGVRPAALAMPPPARRVLVPSGRHRRARSVASSAEVETSVAGDRRIASAAPLPASRRVASPPAAETRRLAASAAFLPEVP